MKKQVISMAYTVFGGCGGLTFLNKRKMRKESAMNQCIMEKYYLLENSST